MADQTFDRKRRVVGTLAGGEQAPVGQGARSQPPVGGGVRSQASEMYRNAILRRLGQSSQGGQAPQGPGLGQTPTAPSEDALRSLLQTRTSRRVLRGRGTAR